MFRVNVDQFYDTNPNDAVGGTSAPSVARRYTRGSVTGQVNHTCGARARTSSTKRASPISTATRSRCGRRRRSRPRTRAPDRCRSPSASRASPNVHSRQAQFSDTLSWSRGKHTLRLGSSIARHTSGGTGSEPGTAVARHVHVPQHDDGAVRSADAGRRAELHAADQLRHQQLRAEAVALRRVRAGQHPREQRPDARRSGSATTVQIADRRDEQLRAARRLRLASRTAIRACRFAAATACTTRSSVANVLAGYLVNGLDGLTTYTATPGQTRVPDLPDRRVSAAVVRSADAAAVAAAGARHHDPGGAARLLQERSSRSTG